MNNSQPIQFHCGLGFMGLLGLNTINSACAYFNGSSRFFQPHHDPSTVKKYFWNIVSTGNSGIVALCDWQIDPANGIWAPGSLQLIDENPVAEIYTGVQMVQEAPCKNCGRKNDVGIARCWCCECSNPC
jgi:hypothetical protein